MALGDPIDAADALFAPHWVPRHVVVDQRAAELEIQPLGRGAGAEAAGRRRRRGSGA